MAIEVRLFALLKEKAGTESFSLSWQNFQTIGDVMAVIEKQHPQLAQSHSIISFARNGEYARAEDPISDGDELALIPPIAGGRG